MVLVTTSYGDRVTWSYGDRALNLRFTRTSDYAFRCGSENVGSRGVQSRISPIECTVTVIPNSRLHTLVGSAPALERAVLSATMAATGANRPKGDSHPASWVDHAVWAPAF